jgi:hypothetical protein
MPTRWGDGELVLGLDTAVGADDVNRLVLRPLGLSVTGAGFDVQVPGIGRVDLHKVAYPSDAVDLGYVELAGERAQHLLDEIAGDPQDLYGRLGEGTGAIVVMGVGDDIATAISNASPGDIDVIDQLGDTIRDLIEAGQRDLIRTAYCSVHTSVPEICPYSH